MNRQTIAIAIGCVAGLAAGLIVLAGSRPLMAVVPLLIVAPVRNELRLTPDPSQQALFGIDKLNVVRSTIPAVTHIDYSARVQTVHPERNPRFYELLQAFKSRTGCPVLVNTSFNVRGEPIVCTPEDAYRCFMRTNIDYLVLWPYLLAKSEQPAWREEEDWRQAVPLD